MSRSNNRRSRPIRRLPFCAGITLVETLVSMLIAAILMGSMYYVYSLSTGAYRVQEQVMRSMEQARFGLEMLKRDIAAAGFLATPDSQADANVCPKPITRLQGIYFGRDQGDVYGETSNVNIQPSSVTLLGAYASPEVFFTQQIQNRIVSLQNSPNFPTTQDEFDQIFSTNHLLRIVNAEQYEMYYGISSADFAARTVTLVTPAKQSIPPDYCGIQGFGVGLEVNVVNYIQYILLRDTRTGAPADGNGNGNKVDLVRQDLTPSGVVVTGSRLVIAEFMADLQFYDFVRDIDPTAQDPTLAVIPNTGDVVNVDGTGLFGLGVGARPQDLRFVTAVLTARSMDEDPNLVFTPRVGLFSPIEAYDSEITLDGAARTVTLASRIEIRAFKVRNVK